MDPHRHARALPEAEDRLRRAEPVLDSRASSPSLDRKAGRGYHFPGMRLLPSEYFHRNMACTFMDDEVGLSQRHLVGIENILWSTDFPHPATTWPNSREIVDRQFADIPDAERDLITCGNSARIYGL